MPSLTYGYSIDVKHRKSHKVWSADSNSKQTHPRREVSFAVGLLTKMGLKSILGKSIDDQIMEWL